MTQLQKKNDGNMKIKYIYGNIILIIFFLLLLFANSCSNDQREEILERYSSGAKYIVGIYEGTGSNEKFIKRKFYQENGKLGRIENLIEESTVTYLDLYPKTKTSEGLKDFLEGSWFKIEKISHRRFDVYESYSMWFDNNKNRFDNYKLQRSVNISICNDTEEVMDISIIVIGDIDYLDDLRVAERNLVFFNMLPTYESWTNFVNHFHLEPIDYTFTLFAELARDGFEIDQSTLLGKYATLNEIQIPNNSIGESLVPLHGTKAEYGDEAIYYIFEKGIGLIKNHEMTKGVMPRSCEDLKNHFR